jgi:hypothetical protein
VVPRGLLITMVLLVIGFIFSVIGSVRVKSKEGKYRRIPSSGTNSSAVASSGLPSSYQSPGISHYAMSPQQKVNTYCVIDSRLVDS